MNRCGRCGETVTPDGEDWVSSHDVNDSVTGELLETETDPNCFDGYPHGPILDV